eukprot:gene9726-3043_t
MALPLKRVVSIAGILVVTLCTDQTACSEYHGEGGLEYGGGKFEELLLKTKSRYVDRIPCLSTFEKAYMKKYSAQLAKGLDALRQPGCFPHGKLIISAGYYRTGSTLLFNMVRLWGVLGAEDNLLAGWGCHKKDKLGLHDGSVSRPRTVICKLHDITVDTAKEADVIIMSHRDPYETICSRRMSNDGQGNWRNWCKNPLHLRKRTDENKEEWDAAVDACLEGNFYEETKDQCRTLLGLQAEVYARREAHGKKIAYDVPLVGWQTEPSKHIGNVARAMGICEAAASDVELHKMIQAMGELLGRDHGHSEDSDLTRMHEVHSDIEREKLCHKLPAAIEADPDCHKWQSNGANSDANRILQYMRQCNVSSVQPFMRGKWYEKVDFQDNNGWEKCSQLGPITEELQPVVPRVKVAPAHLSDLVDSVLREEGKEVMVVANMQQ